MKISVKGGGMYGCVMAHHLQNKGYDVTLHIGGFGLLRGASFKNFRRLHRGYHYPLSMGTAKECWNNHDEFVSKYLPFCKPVRTNYWIAKDSEVDYENYIEFVRELEDQQEHYPMYDSKFQGGIECYESTYNVADMREYFRVLLNISPHEPPKDNFVIDCTYVNSPIAERWEKKESVTLHVNADLPDIAQTVLYGPFCGYIPAEEGGFIVYHAANNNPSTMLADCSEFFPTLKDAKILEVRECVHTRPISHDDNRPYLIEQTDEKEISALGGKVAQSIGCARETHRRLESIGIMPDEG